MEFALIAILPIIIMLGVFGLYIAQVIWVASDSRKRNDEYWWVWTALSIFTCPLGIILYVVISRMNSSKCSSCGKATPKDASICPYCGKKCGLTCLSCGQKIEKGWKYCPNCKITLDSQNYNFTEENKSNVFKYLLIAIALILVIIPIMAFIGIMTFNTMLHSEASIVTEKELVLNITGYEEEYYENTTTEEKEFIIDEEAKSKHSFWYKGIKENGEIEVEYYTSEGNKIVRDTIGDSGEFTECIMLENVDKIIIRLKDYRGYFYTKFN